MTVLSASAAVLNHDSGTYCSWDWGTKLQNGKTYVYAKTTNTSSQSRYLASGVTVYEDETGTYVISEGANATGGNGTSAEAKVSKGTYPSSSYNFTCRGYIYGGTNPNSGVIESWGPMNIS